MSTLIQKRQPPGRPTGGQFAATEHAESPVILGQPTTTTPPRPPARPVSQYRPDRPWQYDTDLELYWDGEHQGLPLEVVEPVNRTVARRALSCPRLPKDRARLVVMHGMPGRRSSERDDHYKVVGPTSGNPMVVRIDSGFHTLEVESGNVRVEVVRSWGGLIRATGGNVEVVVEGSNKHHVEFAGDATGTVRISDDARARISVSSPAPVGIIGGGGSCAVWAHPGSDPRSDTVAIKMIGETA